MNENEIMILAGSGSKLLTTRICEHLKIPLGKGEAIKFSEGNIYVRVLENVRGHQVFIVQSTVYSVNDNLIELLFWIDALKRASAESVTAVIPFFSYGKGDKLDEPRVSIRARVCADAIEASGVDRVVTMDLHTPQILGFFKIPVSNLFALPILCHRIQTEEIENPIIVSPDSGYVKQARRYAAKLGTPLAIANKERLAHDETTRVISVLGEVRDRTAIIVDDFVISGSTISKVAERLKDCGAFKVFAMVTHGVFTPGSIERIEQSPIEKLFITDTVENHPVKLSAKIETVSVASLFAEAIRRICNRESISEMFSG